MNELQFVKRKIFLKRQAVSLIKAEVWDMRALLLRIKVKATIKRILVRGFSHKLIGQRTAQRIYNFLGLKAV